MVYICLILGMLAPAAWSAEIQFEGYYRLELDSKPIGYVIQRYETESKQKLINTATLDSSGLMQEGELSISDSMTVGELEKVFLESFGLPIQISRKSGRIWLETTMTDNWTLKHQNDHGRELSDPIIKLPDDQIIDPD